MYLAPQAKSHSKAGSHSQAKDGDRCVGLDLCRVVHGAPSGGDPAAQQTHLGVGDGANQSVRGNKQDP